MKMGAFFETVDQARGWISEKRPVFYDGELYDGANAYYYITNAMIIDAIEIGGSLAEAIEGDPEDE